MQERSSHRIPESNEMRSPSTGLVTAEELLRLPSGRLRYELINGELRTMSPSGFSHGRIAALLTASLVQFVRSRELGTVCAAETGFRLTVNPDTVLAPDLAFISKQRVNQIDELKGFWPGAPDLAVEVLSPGDSKSEVMEKISQWFSFGTKQVWIVDPKHRTVTVYRSTVDRMTFSGSDDLESQDLFPGLRISLDSIFEV